MYKCRNFKADMRQTFSVLNSNNDKLKGPNAKKPAVSDILLLTRYTIPTWPSLWHKTIFKRAENHMSVHVSSCSFVKGVLVCPVSYLAFRASALHGFLHG